jgi:hypothetical protein
VARDGACFDARINDREVVPIASREALAPYRPGASAALRLELDPTRWQLAQPIAGTIDALAHPNARGAGWFGDRLALEVQVVPLGRYEIAVRPEVVESPDVTVGGQPVRASRNVLVGSTLPPGEYILILRLRGSANWDRKQGQPAPYRTRARRSPCSRTG